jgi:hypothetical protein
MTELTLPKTGSMDSIQRLPAAWSQLNLVLWFYPRIDTKAAVVLGLNLGMIAVLSARMERVIAVGPGYLWLVLFAFLSLFVVSCFHLYRCTVPDRNGGTNSLIFFGSIAKNSESEFLGACAERSADDLISDLLSQTWRNSRILQRKFDALELAYKLMIAAIVPWTIALLIATRIGASLPLQVAG